MIYKWTKWKLAEAKSEYVHWFLDNQPGEERIGASPLIEDGLTLVQLTQDENGPQGENSEARDEVGTSPLEAPPDFSRRTVSRKLFERGLPLPPQAVNDALAPPPSGPIHWLPDPKKLPGNIDNDTIIMGVVDTGIPLGHHRWRAKDGKKTRVLASWQMLANWKTLKQAKLPFGREVYADKINRQIAKFTDGDFFDERAFNIATGTLDPHAFRGPRQIEQRASHGAHVMDLSAGANPIAKGEKAFAKRVRPISVNVPSAGVFGASGTYLDDFLRLAVKRIVDLADAIWLKNNPALPTKGRLGYPIIINMSFGKQAGAKDYVDAFSAWLNELKKYRQDKNLSRLYVVMPAGNDNLTRCNAFLEPKGGNSKTLPWRILPDDQSSNFVEAWTRHPSRMRNPIKLNLIPPDAKTIRSPRRLPKGWKGEYIYTDLKRDSVTVARLYARAGKINRRRRYLKYTLAVPPTYRLDGVKPTGVAGLWEISVKNNSQNNPRLQCVLSVQTDQQLQTTRARNKRSYFDEAKYLTHDDNHKRPEKRGSGRILETYSYHPDPIRNNDYPFETPVRRHGTMNSSASHRSIACIGGYRALDGRPAPYSSSGRGKSPPGGGKRSQDDGTTVPRRMNGGRYAPTASFPTDDAPSHFGILATGSANGSTVAMRGTSFASAQAARELVFSLIDDPSTGKSEKARLAKIARLQEYCGWPHGNGFDNDLIEVLGAGRIPSPIQSRKKRL